MGRGETWKSIWKATMPRSMTSAMLAAISASFEPAIFVQMTFSTGTANMWTGAGPVSWNSLTWTGMGSFLSLGQQIEEGSTVEARGVIISLSGIDPTLLSESLNDLQLGLPVQIWLAAMSGGAPVNSPVLLWSGVTDQPNVRLSATSATIDINCENLLVTLNVPVDRRYTQQDQQMDWPGDVGFNFVNSVQETTINWGTTANSNATNSPSFASRHETALIALGATVV